MNLSARREWYKQASANLRKYLSELEAALVSGQFADTEPIEYLITQVKRRIEDFDRLIKEAKEAERQMRIPNAALAKLDPEPPTAAEPYPPAKGPTARSGSGSSEPGVN